MPDREKVITSLAICTGKCKCLGCWYGQNNPDFRCQDRLKEDALALMKEQEAVKPRECQYPHGTYACGFCDYIPIGNKDGYRANYCPECGKAVKWDG